METLKITETLETMETLEIMETTRAVSIILYRKLERTFMENRDIKLRKTIRYAILGLAVLSVYIAGMFQTLISPLYKVTWNPITIITCFIDEGFPLIVFLIFFAVLTGASIFTIYTDWQSKRRLDKMGRNFEHAEYKPYGNAHFEEPEEYVELAQLRPIEKVRGHILGQLDDKARYCIDVFPDPKSPKAHINEHIFAIGASGSGKTFSVGKNYCFQSMKMGHSVMHSDPDGGLYSDLANIYKNHGYIVRRLNFVDPTKSDGWDAMKIFRSGSNLKKEINADIFATAIMSQLVDNPNTIYFSANKMLLKALILRVVLDPGLPEEKKTLKTVHEWLSNPGGVTFLKTLFEEYTMPKECEPALAPFNMFMSSSPNLLGNLITNLASGLDILSTKIIADILSTDDIDLVLPGQQPCAYFIQFPITNDSYRFPIALFFTLLFEALMNYAQISCPNEKLPVPVDFYLDEFPSIGIIPGWASKMSTIRKHRLNVFMIAQTLTQFELNYKDAWETIISNCAIWLCLGANDQSTANYFSKRIGETSIEVHTEQVSGARKLFHMGAKPTDHSSVGVGKNALVSPAELMNLPANTLLIIFQRHFPIAANAIPHNLHPFSKDGDYLNPSDVSDFYDIKARKEEREQENEFFTKYWQTHSIPQVPDNIDDAFLYYKPIHNPIEFIISIIEEDIAFLLGKMHFNKTRKADEESEHNPEKKKDKKPELSRKRKRRKPLDPAATNIVSETEEENDSSKARTTEAEAASNEEVINTPGTSIPQNNSQKGETVTIGGDIFEDDDENIILTYASGKGSDAPATSPSPSNHNSSKTKRRNVSGQNTYSDASTFDGTVDSLPLDSSECISAETKSETITESKHEEQSITVAPIAIEGNKQQKPTSPKMAPVPSCYPQGGFQATRVGNSVAEASKQASKGLMTGIVPPKKTSNKPM